MTPLLTGVFASQISGHLNTFSPTGSFDALATYTVPAGGTSSITFAGLPTGGQYKHLQIRFTGASNRSVAYSSLLMRVNGDTGNNYAYHVLVGDPRPSIDTSSAGSQSSIYLGSIVTGTTFSGLNSYYTGAAVIDLIDYASNTKNKTIRSLGGSDRNGVGNAGISGNVGIASGLWLNSTTLINSVTLFSDTDFIENTNISIYGVKG